MRRTLKARRKSDHKAEKNRRWREWLATKGGELLSIGLPPEILLDEEHWQDFCTHGRLHYFNSLTGFSIDDLNDSKAATLLHFLERTLSPEETACSALYHGLMNRHNA